MHITIVEFGLDVVDYVSLGNGTAGGVAIAETGSRRSHGLISGDSSVYTDTKVDMN